MTLALSMTNPKFYAWDNETGRPLAFGKVFTYAAGTNDPKVTYTSEDAITENDNPVILNAAGYADIYLRGRYKIVVKDADDVEMWTADPVSDPSNLVEEWVHERAATQVSPSQLVINGDVTDLYLVNRAIKIDDATIFYGTISEVTIMSGDTYVTINSTGTLTSSLSRVWVSLFEDGDALPSVTTSTGTQSLPEALDSRGVVFNSVADMKTFPGLQVGAKVRTLGYYSAGDGGGNDYEIVAASTGADDGGSFIDLSGSGLQAKGLFTDRIPVKCFGAIGDGRNSPLSEVFSTLELAQERYPFVTSLSQTIDYAGAQSAVRYSDSVSNQKYEGSSVFINKGVYHLSNSIKFRSGKFGTPTVGYGGGSIRGEGKDLSLLVATPDNSEGCIDMESDRNEELWEVASLSCLSPLDYDSATNNGIAISIKSTLSPGTTGYGSHPRRSVKVHDFFIGGYGSTLNDRVFKGNFSEGVRVENKWFAEVSDCYIRCAVEEPVGEGRSHAIHFISCYSPEVKDFYISGTFWYGVRLEGRQDGNTGQDYEDFRVGDGFLVNQEIGLAVEHGDQYQGAALYEPGGAIYNLHINAHTDCILIKYHRQVVMTNLYIYVPVGNGSPNFSGNPSGIHLVDVGELSGSNIQFLEPGFYTDANNASCAVKVERGCTNFHLTDVIMSCGGIGFRSYPSSTGSVFVDGITFIGQKTGAWSDFTETVDPARIYCISKQEKDPVVGRLDNTVRSPSNSPSVSLQENLYADRSDFNTESSPDLASRRVLGNNSLSVRVVASSELTDWRNNSSGNEESRWRLWVQRQGSLSPVVSADGSTSLFNVAAPFGYGYNGVPGVSGSFEAAGGVIVTVQKGIITGIN